MADANVRQGGGGSSDEARIIKTVHELTLPHLRRIFDAHAGPDKTWSKDQITSFLTGIQHHGTETHELLTTESLDFNGFLAYMTSPAAALTVPARDVDLDLSWPLACYFISSSHNTYLSGNQLSSDSTTASYTNVLRRGCRCVEVDVWDGEDPDAASVSSSDSEAEAKAKAEAAAAKQGAGTPDTGKKLGRYKSIKGKLPRSLTTRLEKTSLGRKLEEREARKDTATTTVTAVDSSSDAPITATNSVSSEAPAAVVAEKPVTEHQELQLQPEVGLVEPRVLHGYTLTKEISFRDVCTAIRESAFAVTDTPLIVSLEVHCSPAQQATMVKIMKDAWHDVLVAEPDKEPDALPSPDALRNKILVKVKYAPRGSSPEEYESGEDDRGAPPPAGVKNTKPSKIIQDLSRMGVYTRGVSFKYFAQPEASMPTHILSLAENKFLDHHEKQNEELWEHNRRFLMRAYPSGLRIRSSNLNPAPFWGSGAQVVALNWQQTDEGMMLNEAMFAGTGGYVLKPPGKAALSSHYTFTPSTMNTN
jgi:phosphatidylinositol phospholipase C, delta